MDESALNKESPNSEESPVNHVENKEDGPSHSVSPERPAADSEIVTSPVLNEQNIDSRALNAEPTINDEERPVNRDNIPDGFLDPEEVMMQRRALLNAAIASQENGSAFSCKYPGCNFTSTDVEIYLKHEDSHIDGGSVECDVCNQQFPSYASMRRHRLIHLGVRPFECQMCAKRFLRKDQFMEHVLRHSKQRPYRCPFCSRSFGFRPHLKAHLTSDHPNIIIDKTCRICDFKSSSPNGAKVHFAMCHLKQTLDGSEADDRPRDLIGSSQVHATPSDNGAIDLATVSQNFSFVQAAHYSPYSASISDNHAVIPGPSDLSHSSKVQHLTAAPGHRHFIPHNVEQNMVMPLPEEDNRHACVSALAGSTTMASPVTCQDRTCCRPQNHDVPPRERVCVKPEPPELTVDDSQNSVQPTSTMDLSAVDVVETTCVTNEASGSSETPCRRKSHKHSSSDETGSESHNSPPSRPLDVQSTSHSSRSVHTCYRVRQCEESSNQRCRDFSRHTCMAHRHPPEKRPRLSEGSTDRHSHDHSDNEERKVFYNRATSTNSFNQAEIPVPRVIHHTSVHNDGSCTSESHTEPNYFGRKNTIVIRDIESCTLTCPYCGIVFPDQTLYLLHRSLHSEASPWKCNLCGKNCKDKYDFNSHIISKGHY